MRQLFSWSTWSIATKILVPFLALAVVAIAVFACIGISDIREMGRYAPTGSNAGKGNLLSETEQVIIELDKELSRG